MIFFLEVPGDESESVYWSMGVVIRVIFLVGDALANFE